MIKRDRDFQRKRLYTAERSVGFFSFPQMCNSSIKELIRDVLSSDFVKKTNRSVYKLNLPIIETNPENNAKFTIDGLILPEWAKKKMVILHELSHCIHLTNLKWFPEPGHGWRFASFYLKLVEEYISKEKRKELELSFILNNVKYKK